MTISNDEKGFLGIKASYGLVAIVQTAQIATLAKNAMPTILFMLYGNGFIVWFLPLF